LRHPPVDYRDVSEPTLSLCMIAKDEARFLADCLRSVQGVVGEIIVGDTGSSDDTVAIARAFGAKVVDIPWQEDFSAARNAVLDRAAGDWILILDADEELTDGARKTVPRAILCADVMGYNMPVHNLAEEGTVVNGLLLRIFRNRPSIRFKNVVHEQVHDAVVAAAREERMRIRTLPHGFVHKGYLPEIFRERAKDDRNLRLLEKQIRCHPDDLYSRHKYADHLYKIDNGAKWERAARECHDLLHSTFATSRQRIYAAEICGSYALVLEKSGRVNEALDHCREMSGLLHPTPNFLYTMGRLELKEGQTARAMGLFDRCIRDSHDAPAVPIRRGVTGFLSHHALAVALRQLGRNNEAMDRLRSALRDNARYYPSVEALSELLDGSGNLKDSLITLTEYLQKKPEDTRAWLWGGAILTRNMLFDQAVPWLERALRSEATAPEAARLVDRIHDVRQGRTLPRSESP